MKTRLTSLAVLLFLPSLASAQESAPEFRSGQWALQFGGNLNLVTLGIVRFSGLRSAWVMNLDVSGQFLKGTVTSGGFTDDANDHSVFMQGGVGRRFYQSVRSKVRSFQSIGVTGGYFDQQPPSPSARRQKASNGSAGSRARWVVRTGWRRT